MHVPYKSTVSVFNVHLCVHIYIANRISFIFFCFISNWVFCFWYFVTQLRFIHLAMSTVGWPEAPLFAQNVRMNEWMNGMAVRGYRGKRCAGYRMERHLRLGSHVAAVSLGRVKCRCQWRGNPKPGSLTEWLTERLTDYLTNRLTNWRWALLNGSAKSVRYQQQWTATWPTSAFSFVKCGKKNDMMPDA